MRSAVAYYAGVTDVDWIREGSAVAPTRRASFCRDRVDRSAAVHAANRSPQQPSTVMQATASSQLRDELVDLAERGRADRMSFRLEPARWIDGYAAADLRLAPL
jgi:hypothetical protein